MVYCIANCPLCSLPLSAPDVLPSMVDVQLVLLVERYEGASGQLSS